MATNQTGWESVDTTPGERVGHTPGPWHITHEPTLNTYHIRIEDIDAAPIASLFYSSGGFRPQLRRELIDANARLIALSPDLADFARECARADSDCGDAIRERARRLLVLAGLIGGEA